MTLEERFWSKVTKTHSCWLWTGAKKIDGYGQFGVLNKTQQAHRVSWELHYSPIPPGLHVLHRCDNPPCVNPAHLFLGTNADNVKDRIEKGRTATGNHGGRVFGDRNGARTHPETRARGDRHGCAKLTAREVFEIRQVYAEGSVSRQHLAERFGVSRGTIGHIVTGHTWKMYA